MSNAVNLKLPGLLPDRLFGAVELDGFLENKVFSLNRVIVLNPRMFRRSYNKYKAKLVRLH